MSRAPYGGPVVAYSMKEPRGGDPIGPAKHDGTLRYGNGSIEAIAADVREVPEELG